MYLIWERARLAGRPQVPLAAHRRFARRLIWCSPAYFCRYPTLKKPSWQPPNWLFGPVWSVLYTAMGIASWRVWRAGGGPLPLSLYGLQLALNFAWSPLFFKAHNLKAATVDITVLLGVLGATILEFHKVDPTAAALLLPYLAWTSFASALTWNIFLNNPDVSASGLEAKLEGSRSL